jgi:hypothetical protein
MTKTGISDPGYSKRNRPAGRLRAGCFELIRQSEPTWLMKTGSVADATISQDPTPLLPAPTAHQACLRYARSRYEAR